MNVIGAVAFLIPSWFLLRQRNYLPCKVLIPMALIIALRKSTRLSVSLLTWPLVTSINALQHVKYTQKHGVDRKKMMVITGCGTGIGYSLSIRCSQLGLNVVSGCLDLESEGAKILSKKCHVLELDVTKPESVERFHCETKEILENENCELHAVVNNAGVMVFGEFEWLTEDQILQQVDVNLIGSFRITKKFLPLLRKHQGRLINITSHCALTGLPGITVYGAVKAAVQNWSESLRIEQSKYGVKIITFMPGSFPTQTNIMSRQEIHAKEMESAFSSEDRQFFINYFREFNSYLINLPSKPEVAQIDDEKFYQKFTGALLDKNPKFNYTHEPWRYYIYYNLFKISPIWLKDILIEKFVKYPKYKG